MGKQENTGIRKPKCPACASAQVRHVKTGHSYYCRVCGWAGKNPTWWKEVSRGRAQDTVRD